MTTMFLSGFAPAPDRQQTNSKGCHGLYQQAVTRVSNGFSSCSSGEIELRPQLNGSNGPPPGFTPRRSKRAEVSCVVASDINGSAIETR